MITTDYRTRVDISNVSAGWFDQLFIPKKIRGANKYGVIILHGASTAGAGTAFDIVSAGWPSLAKMAGVLASEGIPVIGAGMDGNHYAKPIVTQDDAAGYINKALAYMSAQTGCSATKAHVFGTSMGGGTAVAWAARNPSKCASVSNLIPMASILNLYRNYSGLPVVGGFSAGIAAAGAWNLAFRTVTDAVLNSTTTLTSATAAFTAGDVGKQVIPNAAGVLQANTKIASYTNATTVVLDKAALVSSSGNSIGIGAVLPTAGLTGADLLAVHAPAIDAADIPARFYYASNDPFIVPADVTALATAAGAQAHNLGATGHAEASAAAMASWNGGTDFSDWVSWLKTNGA